MRALVGNARLIACLKKSYKDCTILFFFILAICVISIGELVINSFVNCPCANQSAAFVVTIINLQGLAVNRHRINE